MTIEKPDWDKVVEEAEAAYKDALWKEFGATGTKEYGLEVADKPLSDESAEILDQIALENDRTDPDGLATFDHEEVFRITGKYIVVRRSV